MAKQATSSSDVLQKAFDGFFRVLDEVTAAALARQADLNSGLEAVLAGVRELRERHDERLAARLAAMEADLCEIRRIREERHRTAILAAPCGPHVH